MVFVSYSHLDEEWLERFQTVFSPLSRYADSDLWSDVDVISGKSF